MLWDEAIRLASPQEQNHDSSDSRHHSVAAAHDRRHAHAQAHGEDAEPLPSRGAAVCRLSWALTRHGERRGAATLPVAPGRVRQLAAEVDIPPGASLAVLPARFSRAAAPARYGVRLHGAAAPSPTARTLPGSLTRKK